MKSIPGSHTLYLGEGMTNRNDRPFDQKYDKCQCGMTKRKEHDLCRSCGARRGVFRRRARAVFRKVWADKRDVRFYISPDTTVGDIPPYHDEEWWEDRLLMLNMLERS